VRRAGEPGGPRVRGDTRAYASPRGLSQSTWGHVVEQTVRGLGARLAVLSACQTHLPGKVLPDEVVSLPTGLLQAGVAGVIASYWAVSDAATALLMTRFYHHWKTDRCPPGEALGQAQRWLRDTSNADKLAWLGSAADAGQLPREVAATLGSAVNGDDPGALDFRHPASWAAFAFTGA